MLSNEPNMPDTNFLLVKKTNSFMIWPTKKESKLVELGAVYGSRHADKRRGDKLDLDGSKTLS